MEFFDYDTIGKTDGEIMQMAKNFEEGNGVMVQYFWACELYLRLAEKGNTEAIERLVTRCAITFWLQDHFTISGRWFEITKSKWLQTMEEGSGEAYRFLAYCYINGFCTEVNDEKAVELLKEALKLNDFTALNVMGGMIYKNRYHDENETEESFYLKAAEHNIAVSMFNLGILEDDMAKKVQWFQKAAALNYPRAYYKLGQLYENEDFEENNAIKAYENYKKASDLGDYRAYEKLAVACRYGKGTEENVNAAMYWYCMHYDIVTKSKDVPETYEIWEYVEKHIKEIKTELAEKYLLINFRNSIRLSYDYFIKRRNEWDLWKEDNKHWYRCYKRIPLIVCLTYINGSCRFWEGIEKEGLVDQRAFSWLEKGELINDGPSLLMLAEAIESNFPNEWPTDEAMGLVVEKLEKAIKLNFTGAMYYLGLMYWKGRNKYDEKFSMDKKKAIELIEAAAADWRPAQLFMGNQHFYGNEFVARDIERAIKYWSIPEKYEECYEECVNNLAVVYNSEEGKMNKVKAFLLLNNLSSKNDTIICNLAQMYHLGEGMIQPNIEKASGMYSGIIGKDEKKAPRVLERAAYNYAFLEFGRNAVGSGIIGLKKSKTSQSSYYQIIILNNFLYYCGYYFCDDKIHLHDKDLFHVNKRALKKLTKKYLKSTGISYLNFIRPLLGHSKTGKKLYRRMYQKKLDLLLENLGIIPLQMIPEEENYVIDPWSTYKKNMLNLSDQQLQILENYITALNDDQDNKNAYYENISHWYQENRRIIDSPVMRTYWREKAALSKLEAESEINR